MINKENIEAYIIDYIDGELSAEDLQSLMAFLKEYPAYTSMLDDYHYTKIQDDDILVYDYRPLQHEEKARILFIPYFVKVAASIVGLVGMSVAAYYFFSDDYHQGNIELVAHHLPVTNSDKVTNNANIDSNLQYSKVVTSIATPPTVIARISSNNAKKNKLHQKNDQIDLLHADVTLDKSSIAAISSTPLPKHIDVTSLISANMVKPLQTQPVNIIPATPKAIAWLVDDEQVSGLSVLTQSILNIRDQIREGVPTDIVLFDKSLQQRKY